MTVIDPKRCDECGTCISVCPSDAIVIERAVSISALKCASCGACISVCPFGALSLEEKK
ncbi:MAG: 4Fe-4S binding protein [Chitinispirillales bacterium]|jgi:ferredoxin|nr:4Fe-4S binding protein [Chitinispirillales bacterium]